jgi:hypothetical protein
MVNLGVSYEGGMISLMDEMVISDSDSEPDVLVRIQETDYTIPMVEDTEECPVCYEPYEPVYGSLCGHYTCVKCMKKMDAIGMTSCPMCRSEYFKFPIALACERMFIKG